MIRSMTGFGEASAQHAGVHFFVEIRALNSKYFKAVIRLPEEFQSLEAEIESELRKRLTRGSVFLSGKCTDVTGDAAYEINTNALARYIDQLKRAPQIAGGELRLDLAALLTLPGVLQPPANEEERLERARGGFRPLVDQAVARLTSMRESEGKALLADLLIHRNDIQTRLAAITERAPAVSADYEKRLRTRIEQMLTENGLTIQPVDLVREVGIAAERGDISEEIMRLGRHVEQFTDLLSRDEPRPVGRTLDFLAQEMLREANTIGSKCNDSTISRQIVEIKGAIDRIKEQVQNVE